MKKIIKFFTEDPVWEKVPSAIAKCRRASVTVRMLTGDNVETAKSIVSKSGILIANELNDNDAVMAGQEFNERIRNEKGEVK